VNKARLFTLLITASFVLAFLAGFCLRGGGFNDGGFW
jgi:hypothetical protein